MGFFDNLSKLGFPLTPPPPKENGNGRFHNLKNMQSLTAEERKGLRFSLGPNIQFFSPDHTRTIYRMFHGMPLGGDDQVSRETAFAAAAYLHVAIRYRMRKISEPPLMVVREDKDSGVKEWLSDHLLAPLLDSPSPDIGMRKLLQRTVAYIDHTGSALWKKDMDRMGRVGRVIPFRGDEFVVKTEGDRIYGKFIVETSQGKKEYDPEEVIFFQDINPYSWHHGSSKVDVAMSWLNLGQKARSATFDILDNSLFPSVIVQPNHEWNPDDAEFELFKQSLREYATREERGGPLALLGGGTATKVGLTLKDLIPGDILDRVESVISSVFGIPAVVLQYQIGMENSPWSQMEEARRMVYEDTIEPEWREIEDQLTRQLLWAPPAPGRAPLEEDRAVSVSFDTTGIRALQADVVKMSAVIPSIRQEASLNERRSMVGLEPLDDPRADDVPELSNPMRGLNLDEFENPFASAIEEEAVGIEEEAAGHRPRIARKKKI